MTISRLRCEVGLCPHFLEVVKRYEQMIAIYKETVAVQQENILSLKESNGRLKSLVDEAVATFYEHIDADTVGIRVPGLQ